MDKNDIGAFHTIHWKNFFIVKPAAFNINNMNDLKTKITQWCSSNCKSQFMISKNVSGVVLEFFSPNLSENPIDMPYPISRREISEVILVSFEDPEEATGFKLTFSSENQKS